MLRKHVNVYVSQSEPLDFPHNRAASRSTSRSLLSFRADGRPVRRRVPGCVPGAPAPGGPRGRCGTILGLARALGSLRVRARFVVVWVYVVVRVCVWVRVWFPVLFLGLAWGVRLGNVIGGAPSGWACCLPVVGGGSASRCGFSWRPRRAGLRRSRPVRLFGVLSCIRRRFDLL
jgi:hypothetical protein